MDNILATAIAAAKAFDLLNIRWFVGGSVASSFHGDPRSSMDADLVADIKAEHVEPLVRAWEENWYVSDQAIREALDRRTAFNLIHLRTSVKTDVFVPKPRRFDMAQFERAQVVLIDTDMKQMAPICAPEDSLIAKLEWFRLGGELSDRQWGDILGIIRVRRRELNNDLLKLNAQEVGVGDLLHKALSQGARP